MSARSRSRPQKKALRPDSPSTLVSPAADPLKESPLAGCDLMLGNNFRELSEDQ